MQSPAKKKNLGTRLQRVAGSWRVRTGAVILALLIIGVAVFAPEGRVSANARGDGALVYGVSANTTPQTRTYSGSSNTFGSAAGAVAGTTPQNMIIRASSTKQEMVAGYTDSSGNLQIMCYNGTTWSNEWSLNIGGTGTTRRFDIGYESNSGNVMVLYSTNTATTNELAYRTKSGSSGCGSANWAGATNIDPVRTSGTIAWVKIATDTRGSSNLMAAMWADTGSSASTMIWSGSAWGNEPSSAIATGGGATALERIGATQDVQSFDLAYESSSGDLMIVWSITGTGTTGLIKYTTCTGGTSTCTWPGTLATSIPTVADSGTNLDIASNPSTDEVSMVAIDDGGGANSCDMSAGYWSGSAWTAQANVDTTAECPVAGQEVVSTAWVVNGANTRRVLTYDDATGTGISYKYSSGSAALTSPADFTASPAINDVRAWYDFQTDPFNQNRAMLTISDSTSSLFAKQLTMDSSGNLTWANTEGGSALTASLAQASGAGGDFSFAYWRATSTYAQTSYRWYANANSVQPTTALANQNTAYSTGSNSTILRLRMGLTISTADMDAGSQDFKLQYGTSTSGPWTDIGNPPDTWCNDTSGITCTTSWSYRRKVIINNSASATNLTNFPLLIKLDSTRIDYSKTKAAGQDIRFVDPADPTTVLPYEIEQWNSSGTSYIWVKVPQMDAASSSDYVWMYYGNNTAGDGQDKNNVWDSNYRTVYHSNETTGTVMSDSTSNANNANKNSSSNPAATTGQVAGAYNYAGASPAPANAPNASSLNFNSEVTVSTWIKATSFTGTRNILSKTSGFTPTYGLQVNSGQLDYYYTTGGTFHETTSSTTLTAGNWYYISATFSDAANQVNIYINGALNTTLTQSTTPELNTGVLQIGYDSAGEYFSGIIDELRASSTVRSADWIEAEYLSQNDSMLSFGSEEDQSADASAGVWQFYDNASPLSGASITSALLGGTTVLETYQEKNPTVVNANAVPIGGIGEWDFALDPSGVCGGNYYFRMVKSDGTAFTTYTNYPSLTIDLPAHVPTDKALRHGAWFNNGVKQPYGCDWVSN